MKNMHNVDVELSEIFNVDVVLVFEHKHTDINEIPTTH